MNFDKEGFSVKEQAPEFDENFGEFDFGSADTVKNTLPETLRSVDEDFAMESGVREISPDSFVVRGTIPESANVLRDFYADKQGSAVLDVKSAGFKVKKFRSGRRECEEPSRLMRWMSFRP